ncbi:hypothetical protein KFE25_003687 [Diacronema lutheri]|uniref:Uncharacterized protein n=1 Tax=Diacronema lutheri TaxID=2081491 RepID=A0A8J5X7K2_DIALT|nr:hypothetical protein KFE25_003687 [Diacronema lutheri]
MPRAALARRVLAQALLLVGAGASAGRAHTLSGRTFAAPATAAAPRARVAMGAPALAKPYWAGTLFLSLRGSEELALRVDLIEEPGYEPPQGIVRIDECPAYRAGARTRWLLSEDPEDRRDGLWIWGLFREPLYPFVLLELELDASCTLADGRELPGGLYYLQGGHDGRGKGQGAALSGGTVTRRVPLDVPLVGASATYMEPFPVGSYVARQA